jgi:light-regulated signal transduction histidine kinase (bacteriophytochrome)
VTRNAEAIVMSLPGYTDDDRIEQAPPELKSLLKSVRLLHTRLAMSSLLTNPDSASFGSRRATPVYKVFDRMVRLSNEQALQKKITLRMTGSSYSQPKCYDSFETIPLVLIDNAIKYSCEGRSVEVHVTDSVGAGVSVSVHSFGPVVPVEYQERIFERAVRAPSAKTFASKGSGLGLYFAAIVAQAHGFKISYLGSSDARDPSMGNNTFFFMVGDS